MGLPFAGGHSLAFRRFPSTPFGRPYTSVWHRLAIPGLLDWRLRLRRTVASTLLSAMASRLSDRACESRLVLGAMGPSAGIMRGVGKVRLAGTTPTSGCRAQACSWPPRRYGVASVAAAAELRSSYCSLAHGRSLGRLVTEDDVIAVASGGTPSDDEDAAVATFARRVVPSSPTSPRRSSAA